MDFLLVVLILVHPEARSLQGRPVGKALEMIQKLQLVMNSTSSSVYPKRFGFRLTVQPSCSIDSKQVCSPEGQSGISLGKKTYLRNDPPGLIGWHLAGHLYSIQLVKVTSSKAVRD